MPQKRGKIDLNNCNPRKEEIHVANILADLGHDVDFIKPKNLEGFSTADIKMNGMAWEIKSPTSDKIDAIERNLKRASRQSCNIIFNAHNMKMPLHRIKHELIKISNDKRRKSIARLILIDSHGSCIDIKNSHGII